VGANGVVDSFPSQESLTEGGDLQLAIIDLISASGGLGMGALGPLHMAIKLGGARRENEEPDPLLPAGMLEVSLELATAIHLDSLEGER
jgi:hypothetical protein